MDLTPENNDGGSGGGGIWKLFIGFVAILMVTAILPAVQGITVTKNVSDAIAFITQYGGYTVFANGDLPTGAIVGTTDTQTLSNKTFTGTTIFAGINATSINGTIIRTPLLFATNANITSLNVSSLNISTDITPSANNTANLGSATRWFANLWVNLVTAINGVFTTVNATQLTAITGNISQNLTAGNLTVTGTATGAFGRGATYVIAAADTPTTAKNQADIVVTGNMDDEIEAILTNNISIILLQGNYQTATLDFGVYNNISFGGVDKSSVKITMASGTNNDAIRTGNLSAYVPNIYFHDFTLLGNSAGNSAGYGLHFKSVENGWVNNVEIRDFNNDGIRFEGGASRNNVYGKVTNSYIVGNNGSGIMYTGQSYGGIVDSNVIAGNGAVGSSDGGIRTLSNSEHTITNNLIDENNYGIFSYNTATMVVAKNTILNCERDAISAYTGSLAEVDWVIDGNVIISPSHNASGTFSGIRGDFVNSAITNNVIEAIFTPMDAGIRELSPSNNNTIIGNVISGLYSGHLGVYKVGTGSIVRSNIGYITENSGNFTITAGQWGASFAHGLATNATAVQLTLTGNTTTTVYVSFGSITSTNFTANLSALQGGDVTGVWRAVIGAGN